MPELPDIEVYAEALRRRCLGKRLERVRVKGPFLVRTVTPEPEAAEGRVVLGVSRLGKRLVLEMERELFLVLHLMIAGRLLWKPPGTLPRGKIDLAALEFGDGESTDLEARSVAREGEGARRAGAEAAKGGTLLLTEASTQKRAGLWVVQGTLGLAEHQPGGLDVLGCSEEAFAARLRQENRTLKRALTSPALFDGIGNAYSDEILHAARLSPVKLTRALSDEDVRRLHVAAKATLEMWTARLMTQFALDKPGTGTFPGAGQITAFRPEFAVHGKFGQPCPVCGKPVQRIVRAENEINYCALCQNGGRVLADRSLSRLLRDDWPRDIEAW